MIQIRLVRISVQKAVRIHIMLHVKLFSVLCNCSVVLAIILKSTPAMKIYVFVYIFLILFIFFQFFFDRNFEV